MNLPPPFKCGQLFTCTIGRDRAVGTSSIIITNGQGQFQRSTYKMELQTRDSHEGAV